jgi:hypothetical protein
MQRTPLVGGGAEPDPGSVGTAGASNLLNDHVVIGSRHSTAAMRDYHDATHVEQMDPGNAAGQRRGCHSTAWGSNDLGITESQTDHFKGHDSGVHAGDHQNACMCHPVESVLIKVLSELLVVRK